jgi:L,D-peptidoglycan transpeptidase YkuD (ErfK/YbiS/YcfS/YnhG family)
LIVNELRIQTQSRTAHLGDVSISCRIGRAGAIPMRDGREGDAKTPLGEYVLRCGLYRADRLPAPPSPLTFRPIRESDGWCDAPEDPAYNRHIRLPYPASHERLWREDGVYDIILVISHNDSPPVPGLGSAVFLHIAQPDDRATLGCVAFAPDDMVKLLPELRGGMAVKITV